MAGAPSSGGPGDSSGSRCQRQIPVPVVAMTLGQQRFQWWLRHLGRQRIEFVRFLLLQAGRPAGFRHPPRRLLGRFVRAGGRLASHPPDRQQLTCPTGQPPPGWPLNPFGRPGNAIRDWPMDSSGHRGSPRWARLAVLVCAHQRGPRPPRLRGQDPDAGSVGRFPRLGPWPQPGGCRCGGQYRLDW